MQKAALACPSTLRQAQGWQAQDVRQHGAFLFAGHYSPGRANNDLQAMNYLCLA
jgi:hypothetical protein